MPELDHLSLLSSLDVGALAMACESFALARVALESMRDGSGAPAVLAADRAHSGQRRHPALLAYASALREYRALCVEFGLTPSARAHLRLTPYAAPAGGDGDDGDDGDAAFFGT